MSRQTPAVGIERKLAAIFSTDVAGYSRLMGDDEEATIRTLTAYREVISSLIQQYRGRVVDSPGDNLLAEFASVVDAVRCAVEIQEHLKTKNTELPAHRQMHFRIGINLGDVIVEGERLYGDGVNITARLESLAEPDGVCISGTAYDQVKNKVALGYEYLGEREVKNIAEPVRVYRIGIPSPLGGEGQGEGKVATPLSLQSPEQRAEKVRRKRAFVTVTGLFLIGATFVAVRYLPFSLLGTHPSGLGTEETQPPSLPLPDKPSIAVLPFTNMSGDPEHEYFSDGMTDDIITDLTKISGLFVIARNSVFTYKGKAVKVKEVGRELGVRYVLEGSARRADGRVRINAQLIDASTGGHLWAERYDRELKDLFTVQDEITEEIIQALRVEVQEAERARVRRIPTDNLTAYDAYLRGVEYFWRYTPEANTKAWQLFERATELDPSYADAYTALGFTYVSEFVLQWSQDPQTLERAFEMAQKALSLDDVSPGAHLLLSVVYLWRDRDHERAMAAAKQALALDPNDANTCAAVADKLRYVGRGKEAVKRAEEAIELLQKATRLDPHYPAFWMHSLAVSYYITGQYEEALTAEKRALHLNPDFLYSHVDLAAISIELGREEEARAEAVEVLRRNPHFSLEIFRQAVPMEDVAILERYVAALRKAGLK